MPSWHIRLTAQWGLFPHIHTTHDRSVMMETLARVYMAYEWLAGNALDKSGSSFTDDS